MRRGDSKTTWLRMAASVELTGLLLAALPVVGCAPPRAAPARVAAAASLQPALTDITRRFTVDTGHHVNVVFGSSGLLTRQIQQGAPFELFLSADEESVERLAAAGLTRDAGVQYAVGRLVLFTPHGGILQASDGLPGLARLVAAGQVPRFAIANPAHAPYGRAAEQVLRTHGLWDVLTPYLVLGDNVAQAAQFATAGSAVGGLIAYSLALTPEVLARGTHTLVDQNDHEPLAQRMVLLNRAGPTALRFYDYMQEIETRAVLERYGFASPAGPQ